MTVVGSRGPERGDDHAAQRAPVLGVVRPGVEAERLKRRAKQRSDKRLQLRRVAAVVR
jgi:hypothetical protein